MSCAHSLNGREIGYFVVDITRVTLTGRYGSLCTDA